MFDMDSVSQNVKNFKQKNRVFGRRIPLLLLVGITCGVSWLLWMWYTGLPPRDFMNLFVNTDMRNFIVNKAIFLGIALLFPGGLMLILKQFRKHSVMYFLMSLVLFGYSSFIEHKYQNSPLKMSNREFYATLDFFKEGNFPELEKLMARKEVNADRVMKDYWAAQVQVRSGKPGPYLERTVSALRQGDPVLNSQNFIDLAKLEEAYDGQVLSPRAKAYRQWRWLEHLLLLPLALFVVKTLLWLVLKHRENKMTKKLDTVL